MGFIRSTQINEQQVLRFSIVMTFVMTIVGLTFGFLASSMTIIFDSVYELIDVVMTALALVVSKLIVASTTTHATNRRLTERFTMGFWHLEPIVLGANGILLMGASVYGFINAIDSILTGGRQLAFDYALAFAVLSLIIELSMGLFIYRANKQIKSDFVALDAKAWLMAAAITVAYLFAFSFGLAAQDSGFAHITPYVDPVILALVCLIVTPIPFTTVRRALADILLVTPPELKHHVDTIAEDFVRRYGFDTHRAYVARVGRGRQIELYFLVPENYPARTLAEWDLIRDEVSDAIGGDTPHHWLTIMFTSDDEWL